MLLDGADVGVGSEKNVLQLRLLLVGLFDGFPGGIRRHVGIVAGLERKLLDNHGVGVEEIDGERGRHTGGV